MALNTSKCNHLAPLRFKGLIELLTVVICLTRYNYETDVVLMLLWLMKGRDKGDGNFSAECCRAAVWSRFSDGRQTWLLQSLTERFVLNYLV